MRAGHGAPGGPPCAGSFAATSTASSAWRSTTWCSCCSSWPFAAGARSISLVSSVEEALALRQAHPDWLVMGEVGGLPPDGFDFGNSPAHIHTQNLTGRHLVQRTGAGTQGVVRSTNARVLLAASFVVASATVRYVKKLAPREVTFLTTGGAFNVEDLACAEYLRALFYDLSPDPAPFIEQVYHAPDAALHLNPSRPEFPLSDLDFCTRVDAHNFAMPVSREDGRLVLHPVVP